MAGVLARGVPPPRDVLHAGDDVVVDEELSGLADLLEGVLAGIREVHGFGLLRLEAEAVQVGVAQVEAQLDAAGLDVHGVPLRPAHSVADRVAGEPPAGLAFVAVERLSGGVGDLDLHESRRAGSRR